MSKVSVAAFDSTALTHGAELALSFRSNFLCTPFAQIPVNAVTVPVEQDIEGATVSLLDGYDVHFVVPFVEFNGLRSEL